MTANAIPLAQLVAAAPVSVRVRLVSIDALRGVALVAMALDHAAAFAANGLVAETYLGQPPHLLSWPYWVSGLFTNLAAPTFWLLAGVSVYLFVEGRRASGVPEWAITRFLLIRAAVIVALDLTVSWWLWGNQSINPYTHVLLGLGITIGFLSVARRVPIRLFAALTFAVLIGYQAYLATARLDQPQAFPQVWFLLPSLDAGFAVEFPVVGWGVLTCFGFVVGHAVRSPVMRRARAWISLAAALFGVWFVLRLMGGFGDTAPYATGDAWYTFFIMSKAPASLTFLAFNLGLSALLMSVLVAHTARLESGAGRWLAVFGQVSLFFFVFHLGVYHVLGQLALDLSLPIPPIARIYLVWAIGLVIVAPVVYTYRRLRRQHPNSILRYL